MPGSVAITVIVALLGFYGTIAYVAGVVVRGRQRRTELAAEVQTKLIDRFGSAPELIDFLQSEAGERFVSGFHDAPRNATREKIISGMRRGIVVSLLGLGLLAIFAADIRGNWGFLYPGCILLALGVGFFLSTFASMRLSQSWGLIETGTAIESRLP
jgi:hypothetical protein